MNTFILILCLLALALIAYYASGEDILSPAFLICITYIVGLIIMYTTWKPQVLLQSVIVITLGMLSFTVTEIATRWIGNKAYNRTKYWGDNGNLFMRSNNPSRVLLATIITLQILCVLLYAREIMRIAGLSLWESVIYTRKRYMYSQTLAYSDYTNIFVSRLMKFNMAAGYVNTYFLLKSIALKRKTIYKMWYLVSICAYLVQALLSGGRMQFLRIAIGGVLIVIVLFMLENDWKNRIPLKTMFKIIVFVIITLLVFYSMRMFVGRLSQKDLSFWDIISMYYASGLYLFNEYMSNPIRNTGSRVGSVAFRDIYNLLYKFGLRSIRSVPQLEFKEVGSMYSNTYTALYYYYRDFGLIGVIVLQSVFSFLFNSVYNKIKYQKKEILIPVYAYFFFAIIMHVVADQFFNVFSFGTIETVILILAIYWAEEKLIIKMR